MADTKKYISLDKLSLYDEKIKKVISDGDKATLDAAKAHAESLAVNYDAAGAAATAEANAKAYADGKDAAIQAAQKAADDAAAAAGVADGKAVKAQGDVDTLKTYVGTIPADATATNVVAYVQEKTAGIASEGTVTELSNRVGVVEGKVSTIEGDYLKAADKNELAGDIADAMAAVDAEKARAEGIEGGLRTDVDAIKADYLKAADKTALQGNIDGVAGRVATIEGDYLKGADKTELEGRINAKADQTALDAEIERATQAEAGLQTQINTIMNNPDTEGVINSINEFTQYIADHGEIADGFRADINANKKAIEDHEALAAQTYETKEDATAKYDEVKAEIAAIPQADWNQNDETAADYVKNRTHYEAIEASLVKKYTVATDTLQSGSDNIYMSETSQDMSPSMEEGVYFRVVFDGVTYDNVHFSHGQGGNDNIYTANACKNPEVPFAIGYNGGGAYELFTTTPGEHTIAYYSMTNSIKQLDEKFIPDTIARVADVEAMETELQGKIDVKADASALTSAVEALEAADADIIERVAAVEAQLGDGDGSVADLIAVAKDEAIEAAKTDASNKDAVVLSEAQKHADAEDAKIEARVAELETASATHALKSDVEAVAGRMTTAEGEIDVLQGEMDAVEALAAAAEAAAKANAAAIALKASQADLEAVSSRVTSLETWHNNFTEVSEEEINGLFA